MSITCEELKRILEELKRKPEELNQNNIPLEGKCPGVYFLFNKDDLVYIGHSWDCFLGVAENTRKDNAKNFTSWNFIHIEDKTQRIDFKNQLIRKINTKYNE